MTCKVWHQPEGVNQAADTSECREDRTGEKNKTTLTNPLLRKLGIMRTYENPSAKQSGRVDTDREGHKCEYEVHDLSLPNVKDEPRLYLARRVRQQPA